MVTILAILALGAGSLPAFQHEPRHVRSQQPEMRALLSDGILRSPTFAALVATLDASDVVAYVEWSMVMPGGLDGYLVHKVTTVGERRYLRIVVNAGLQRDRLLSIVAHELQHAREVAEDASVRSDDAIRTLFRRLDSGSVPLRYTETNAAKHVQRVVLRELLERPTQPQSRSGLEAIPRRPPVSTLTNHAGVSEVELECAERGESRYQMTLTGAYPNDVNRMKPSRCAVPIRCVA